MSFQFASKAASRLSTVNLERQLLHYLITDRMSLQRTIGRHRVDFFTNSSRRFIYECAMRLFNDHRIMLTKAKFEFESSKIFDSATDNSRIEDLNAEYDLIVSITVTDSTDSIIESLEEVQLGNEEETIVREAYEKIKSGSYKEVATFLKQKAMELQSKQKEGRIINLHKDSDDWFEEVKNRHDNPQQYAGIQTGFEKFDKLTGGLFPAELTVVFGLSGKGKSTFMKALACNMRKFGRVILHCGNEENEFQMRSKYMSADSGEKYSPFKRGTYTEDEFKRLKIYSDNARGVGAIYIYEFPQQTDVMWIERAYRFLEMQGVHVDAIIIDYLDLMKPVQQAYNENDEQGKVTSDLKQLAINCNCPVITATQAGTQSEKQEKKEKPFLTAADVFGTKRKVHSANTLIGIVNQTATAMANELNENERKKHHIVLCVPKNRDGAVFTFRQVMDVECGKFYEDTDEGNPMMDNLEKQAKEMIDETISPDRMRTEISMKEIIEAKKNDLEEQARKLAIRIQESSSEEIQIAPTDVSSPVVDESFDTDLEEPVGNSDAVDISPIKMADSDDAVGFDDNCNNDDLSENEENEKDDSKVDFSVSSGVELIDFPDTTKDIFSSIEKIAVSSAVEEKYNNAEERCVENGIKEMKETSNEDTGIKHKKSMDEILRSLRKK